MGRETHKKAARKGNRNVGKWQASNSTRKEEVRKAGKLAGNREAKGRERRSI